MRVPSKLLLPSSWHPITLRPRCSKLFSRFLSIPAIPAKNSVLIFERVRTLFRKNFIRVDALHMILFFPSFPLFFLLPSSLRRGRATQHFTLSPHFSLAPFLAYSLPSTALHCLPRSPSLVLRLPEFHFSPRLKDTILSICFSFYCGELTFDLSEDFPSTVLPPLFKIGIMFFIDLVGSRAPSSRISCFL